MSKLWQTATGLFLVLVLVAPYSASAQAEKKAKDLEWKHGMYLRVRSAGVADFTKDTKKYGVEAFNDDNSGYLFYISETAALAAVKGGSGKADGSKAPDWRHAMDLSVRKAGEAKFTKDTRRYGVEVFRDENTGNLVYVSETGSIAVAPGGAAAPASDKAKAPDWKSGFELSVRKAGEKDFNKDTKKFGVEAFRDENNGNLIYISETGSIAVVTGVTATGDKVPEWKHGFELSVRKAGEKDFSKDTKRYNIEVFQDENNGNALYISETGDLAVSAGVKVAGGDKVKPPEWKYASNLAVRKPDEKEFTKDTKRYGVEVFRDENDGLFVAVSESGSIALVAGK